MLLKFQVKYQVSRNKERDHIIIYTRQKYNIFNIYPLKCQCMPTSFIWGNNMCAIEFRSYDIHCQQSLVA
jgi:hypothetical protein